MELTWLVAPVLEVNRTGVGLFVALLRATAGPISKKMRYALISYATDSNRCCWHCVVFTLCRVDVLSLGMHDVISWKTSTALSPFASKRVRTPQSL
jgi:hypothetical protein